MTYTTLQLKRRPARSGYVGLIAFATVMAACTGADAAQSGTQIETPAEEATAGTMESELERVRVATLKYKDVAVALAEGYIPDPMNVCETAEMMGRPATDGAMGLHYVRPDLLGITGPPNPRVNGTSTHTDFMQPGVLIYEPQEDGSLELVAVENLVFIASWEAAGNTAPPVFMDRAYDRMVDDPATEIDEAHHFEPHYDLHVWLHRENPRGVFAQFNPNATCAHHRGDAHMHG